MQYRAEIRTNDTTHHGNLTDATTPEQAEQIVENIRRLMQGQALYMEQAHGTWLVIPTREIRHIRVVPVEVTES